MHDLYVGIMSGTSLDGIDVALTSFKANQRAELIGATCLPLPPALKQDLLTLCEPGPDEVRRAQVAGQQWARLAATGVEALLRQHDYSPAQITAIGSHGQTIRHHPELGFSVQIGAPALLAELTGIAVISDFRSRDIAAGGQGAPLVPAFHDWLLAHPTASRVLLNIGGFANLTLLRPGQTVTGFDSGPGNVLMDAWSSLHHGQPYDEDGAWARSGQPIEPLLTSMLADPYFARTGPKSTGREHFNAAWIARHLADQTHSPDAADVQATLLELTARSIARTVVAEGCEGVEIYVCGGGARNGFLMQRLQELLVEATVRTTDALGINADWMEAMAFAWLAWRRTAGLPGNLPAVTGAKGPRVLGAIYPA